MDNSNTNVQSDIDLTPIDNFDNMGLNDKLLRGIYSYGFEKPSEIQSRSIKPFITGHDLIAQAQSGTGKTGSFTIGMLERVDPNLKECQGLIIAPTRELAIQINKVANNIGNFTGIKAVLCIGGTSKEDSIHKLRNCASIVVGTPGRIGNMIENNNINPNHVKTLVLDEADEMLAVGFIQQIKFIICHLPEDTQICLFSATMPNEILNITSKFMRNPVNILVKQEELTLEGIQQYYINVDEERWKFSTFCDLYNQISLGQAMVYVNKKDRADRLKRNLEKENFTVSVIHSKMTQKERSDVMNDFINGSTRILISTDLLARGIDVQQVSVVINYDIPFDKECYIHRIGRSGRFGRKGVAINFVTRRDKHKINFLENFYQTRIEEMPASIEDIIRNT